MIIDCRAAESFKSDPKLIKMHLSRNRFLRSRNLAILANVKKTHTEKCSRSIFLESFEYGIKIWKNMKQAVYISHPPPDPPIRPPPTHLPTPPTNPPAYPAPNSLLPTHPHPCPLLGLYISPHPIWWWGFGGRRA